MIRKLQLTRVGPAESMSLDFSEGVNVLTGDNGVGKSFLLDVIWWVLTRQWPQEINPVVQSGRKAEPSEPSAARIRFRLSGERTPRTSMYDAASDTWPLPKGREQVGGLVLYAMVDGSFAIWDACRSSSAAAAGIPYVFSPVQIWNGLASAPGEVLCNGIISDLRDWYLERGDAYELMQLALAEISDAGEPMQLDGLTRVGADARRIPTLRMPYSGGVPVTLASAALRRMIALAYSIVWGWLEHRESCRRRSVPCSRSITVMVDELEAHLHPRWQRTILKALHSLVGKLTGCRCVQMVVSTHSPLVMASCEEFFNPGTDSWIDMDVAGGAVVAANRAFEKRGTSDKWLESSAFDLTSTRSVAAERCMRRAYDMMDAGGGDRDAVSALEAELARYVPARDAFWLQWDFFKSKHSPV